MYNHRFIAILRAWRHCPAAYPSWKKQLLRLWLLLARACLSQQHRSQLQCNSSKCRNNKQLMIWRQRLMHLGNRSCLHDIVFACIVVVGCILNWWWRLTVLWESIVWKIYCQIRFWTHCIIRVHVMPYAKEAVAHFCMSYAGSHAGSIILSIPASTNCWQRSQPTPWPKIKAIKAAPTAGDECSKQRPANLLFWCMLKLYTSLYAPMKCFLSLTIVIRWSRRCWGGP